MKISVICPTRKRTAHVKRLLDSIVDTASSTNNVETLFVIDDDDTESIKYFSSVNDEYNFDIKHVVVPRLEHIFSDLANQALPQCEGELFLAIGDDGVFRTDNWDQMIIEQFEACPDKILLVHFNDLTSHCGTLAGHLAVHQKWINTVGYFSPPWFDGDWGDWWLTHVSNGVGRKKYRPDIVIEHMHITFGKADADETFYEHKKRREAFGSPTTNPEHPFNTKNHIMQKNIEDLKKVIEEYKV